MIGPKPMTPFSEWKRISRSGGTKLLQKVGIPTPRLTIIPSWNSLAARMAIVCSSSFSPGIVFPPSLPYMASSQGRGSLGRTTTRCTYTPGVTMHSGSSSPSSTTSSTSATVTVEAPAITGLNVRAVPL